MRRVKALHLITHLGNGGATDNTLMTVQGHARERYEVHLAAGPAPGQGYTNWEPRARACADSLFILPSLRRPPHPQNDLRALGEIRRLLREQRYDIVHTHCSKAGVLGRIAARHARVPIVVHTFHSFAWQVTKAPSKSPIREPLRRVRKQVYILVERYAARLSDALITVCDRNREEAIGLRIAPPEKFLTIYSGIDLERFAIKTDRVATCRDLGLDPLRPIVGSIGRLSTQKAPLDLVRAARIVLQRRPDVQFLMVGDGPLADAVAKEIDGETRIKMLGYHGNVPEILSVLDVFALSSLWEGLGRALTEAMAAGVPVAATAVDGIPELAVHGETGLLSSPHDPAGLAANVVKLLEDPRNARAMAERARERVVPAFGAPRMVERIEGMYSSLLARKGLIAEQVRIPAVARP